MDAAKRKQIWDFAGKVRHALKLSTPISEAQLEGAIGRLGGEVVDASGSQPEASIRKIASGFSVGLDRSKPPKRRLFSLAHELGHLFIHMKFANPPQWAAARDYEESYARSGYDEEELQANEFAASLLMPADEFAMAVAQNATVSGVADFFGVSTDAALIRGRWLNHYPWA